MCTCTDADGEGNWNNSQGVCVFVLGWQMIAAIFQKISIMSLVRLAK